MSQQLWVGTRKGLFQLVKKNKTWEVASRSFLAVPVSIVLPDGPNIYAALDHGHFGVKLHRSTDNGATWKECAAPAYPEKPGDVEDVIDNFGKPIPWSLKLIWALEKGARSSQLWCGTVPGGLFESRDNGDSWTFNRTLWDDPKRRQWFGGGMDMPGIHSLCVDPRHPDTLRIGISCGGMWLTRDGGKSWSVGGNGMRAEYMPPEKAFDPNIQDPHRLVQCPASPDHLWVQHHNGIFRSTDAGQSWQEIKSNAPSYFGFAVAVHPKDPNTAWFVPAVKDEKRIPADGKFIVTRTRDGGKSFDVLSKGLPAEESYDIVFRHCLDIDTAGNSLAMASTTGGLWITENQGDSWTQLPLRLPPVYCVRWS